MTTVFSTMWAQQDRFADLGYFRDVVAGMGFDAIEVSHSTAEPGLLRLLAAGGIRAEGLHAPTPDRRVSDGRRNAETNLASPDAEERRLSLAEHLRTIEFAAEHGLRYVVVHLGGVGPGRMEEERALRRLFEQGETAGEAWDAARRALRNARAAQADAHLEAAAASLETLVDQASRHGVVIGIESRLNYHEIPHPQEAALLLAPYGNDHAGFWYDVGHCEVQSRLGMIDHGLWKAAIPDRFIGAHLHDVRGILDHRAPGNGTLDWRRVAVDLPSKAVHVLEIDQHEPDEAVAGSIEFLRRHGVV